MRLFLDTSALAKLFVPERQGYRAWLDRVLNLNTLWRLALGASTRQRAAE